MSVEDELLPRSERVERSLMLNGREELRELLETVGKVVGKILENPEEDKYRKVRTNSKVLGSKVLSKPGGRELMGWLGFRSQAGVEPVIEFARRDDEKARLEAAASFLTSFAPRRKDAELSIRLPNGASIHAGFEETETVGDVLKFVEQCTSRDIVLSTSRPLRKFQGPDLRLTLREADLIPRAAVLAVDADADAKVSAAEQAAVEARKLGLEEKAREKRERDEKERKLRLDKLARKRDVVQQRADALRHFDADRQAKTERVERDRRNAELRRARADAERVEGGGALLEGCADDAQPKAEVEDATGFGAASSSSDQVTDGHALQDFALQDDD